MNHKKYSPEWIRELLNHAANHGDLDAAIKFETHRRTISYYKRTFRLPKFPSRLYLYGQVKLELGAKSRFVKV